MALHELHLTNLISYNSSSLGISNIRWTVPSSWRLFSGLNQSGIVVESPSSNGTFTISVRGISCGVTVSKSIRVTVTGGGSDGPGGGGIFAVGRSDLGLGKNNAEITGSKADIIQMYPNPVSDVLKFRSTENKKISHVELFNLEGKRVISKSINTNSNGIDVKSLHTGLYMVHIVMKDGSSLIKKVQVNK